eukprot:m.115161 g.115161  ORF g.115161 m.115161 type:complete len:429 (-) comp19381_c0_seq1:83-1369(-)
MSPAMLLGIELLLFTLCQSSPSKIRVLGREATLEHYCDKYHYQNAFAADFGEYYHFSPFVRAILDPVVTPTSHYINLRAKLEEEWPAGAILIPFDVEASFSATHRGHCPSSTHLERMQAVLALLNTHDLYIWPAASWRIDSEYPEMLNTSLQKYRILRFSEYEQIFKNSPAEQRFAPIYYEQPSTPQQIAGHPELSRGNGGLWFSNSWARQFMRHQAHLPCGVAVPIISQRALINVSRAETPFSAWKKRKFELHYRGGGRLFHDERANFIRQRILSALTALKNASIASVLVETGHADSPQHYVDELFEAQFCFCGRADDPQTSRFVESVAAGCIPVTVNEGFGWIAPPFNFQIAYNQFTISIPESLMEDDPQAALHTILNLHEDRVEQLHAGLMKVRRALLWRHPESETFVYTLRELKTNCARVINKQ